SRRLAHSGFKSKGLVNQGHVQCKPELDGFGVVPCVGLDKAFDASRDGVNETRAPELASYVARSRFRVSASFAPRAAPPNPGNKLAPETPNIDRWSNSCGASFSGRVSFRRGGPASTAMKVNMLPEADLQCARRSARTASMGVVLTGA